jgi:hypothetical protein
MSGEAARGPVDRFIDAIEMTAASFLAVVTRRFRHKAGRPACLRIGA